ncbi:ribonuclease Z [Halalkalibacillus sediminis]|uniref:Ribonuclease Z n=1 Tax=Halalkalibacillus sediminis TaxID=2018042 RepID=A0A2I0QX83_9BACI|nr:ribonuclease Z [Halalkalibacillus sediminis]PKR78919.1 ribonuclease Z [Halalkalibacillus sediminis]
MELEFLGTGSGVPSKIRNVSSIALKMLQERDEVWLFDCGEATQHQLLSSTIKPRKISKIFITHMHGDHIFGLPGLLSSRSFQNGTESIQIFGPKGLKKFLETSLETSHTRLKYDIEFVELNEGMIFEDEHLSVSCFTLIHGVPSYGFVIQERDSIGHLLPEKLKEKGIHPGPIYQEIKKQEVTVLPDGTHVHRDEVTGPPIKGRKIVICGDTKPTKDIVQQAKDADVLVHEATFTNKDLQLAEDYNHSSSHEVVRLASLANVSQLLLTHLSSRYNQSDLEQELNQLKSIFHSVQYAYDSFKYEVK